MEKLNLHIFKGEKKRNDNSIKINNSIVYSELKSFETQLYSGHFGVKLPLSGLETYITGGKKYNIKSNNYLLTNPKVKTEVVVKSETVVKGICIGLTPKFVHNLISELNSNYSEVLELNKKQVNTFHVLNHHYGFKINSALPSFLNYIKYLWNKGELEEYPQEQFYYDLGELIIKSQININSKISNLPNARLSTREEIYRRVDIMNQYIHDSFTENITIEELSQIACLSKFHAVRCYQKIEGISPYKKITALRLQKAIELLNNGFAVSEVSDLCGFTDYRAFSKLFKKQLGITPSIYLKSA